jgi:hypothetical protein
MNDLGNRLSHLGLLWWERGGFGMTRFSSLSSLGGEMGSVLTVHTSSPASILNLLESGNEGIPFTRRESENPR